MRVTTRCVTEADAHIVHDLRADAAAQSESGVNRVVPEREQAAITVHSGVSHILAHEVRHAVEFKQPVKFLVDDLRDALHVLLRALARKRSCLHLDVVGRDVRNGKQNDLFQEVVYRRRQTLRVHALPLLANEEVLVGAHRLVEVDSGVVAEHFLVLCLYLLRRDLLVKLVRHRRSRPFFRPSGSCNS